jgi:hypothetical protein
MSDLTNASDASTALFDAHLSPEDLATIAQNHPNLWARVAWHQNAYPELLSFLAANGDQSVTDAVKTRRELLGEPKNSGPHLPASYRAAPKPTAAPSESLPSATDLLSDLDALFKTPLTPKTPPADPTPLAAPSWPTTPKPDSSKPESSLDAIDRLFASAAASTPQVQVPPLEPSKESHDQQPGEVDEAETTDKIQLGADEAEADKPAAGGRGKRTSKGKTAPGAEIAADAPAYPSEAEDDEDANPKGSSGKKIGIIALIVAVVAALIVGGYFVFFHNGSGPSWLGGSDDTALTASQYAAFVGETFPAEAKVGPLPVENGQQNFAQCDAQANVSEFALLRSDPNQGQGVAFRLFDTTAHTEQYASQIKDCWTELGRVISSFDRTTTDGVTYYEMPYDGGNTAYFAVYHNVFVFLTYPAPWLPLDQFATVTFKNAVDKALLVDPSATPELTPPAPPKEPATTAPPAPAESVTPGESTAPTEPAQTDNGASGASGTQTP